MGGFAASVSFLTKRGSGAPLEELTVMLVEVLVLVSCFGRLARGDVGREGGWWSRVTGSVGGGVDSLVMILLASVELRREEVRCGRFQLDSSEQLSASDGSGGESASQRLHCLLEMSQTAHLVCLLPCICQSPRPRGSLASVPRLSLDFRDCC